MKKLPARLYICPACGYSTEYRWVLVNHLRQVEGEGKINAQTIAQRSEYYANPLYYRIEDEEY